jgi:hypothetical protein
MSNFAWRVSEISVASASLLDLSDPAAIRRQSGTVNGNQGGKGSYLSAAHLQGGVHGGGGGSEAWIAAVPEATELPLYGGIVTALFLGAWRRIQSRTR